MQNKYQEVMPKLEGTKDKVITTLKLRRQKGGFFKKIENQQSDEVF